MYNSTTTGSNALGIALGLPGFLAFTGGNLTISINLL